MTVKMVFSSFHATGFFLYPLKISENQRFSDVFRGYRKRSVPWDELKHFDIPISCYIFKQLHYLCIEWILIPGIVNLKFWRPTLFLQLTSFFGKYCYQFIFLSVLFYTIFTKRSIQYLRTNYFAISWKIRYY